MEFADGGDLLAKVKSHKETSTLLKEDAVWSVFLQVLAGTAALHRHSVVHRDLKVPLAHQCANIFLFADGRVKIGDLNVSKVAKLGFLTTQTGTPYYTRYARVSSPEIYKDKPYDTKSDMWSLGCILYEMCCFRPPFVARNFKELRRAVMLGAFPPLPAAYSEEVALLVKALLQLNPADRPSSAELLKNPFVLKKMRRLLEPGLSPDLSETDHKKQLMKTIRMKDLETLKLVLPAPKYDARSASVHNRDSQRDLQPRPSQPADKLRPLSRSRLLQNSRLLLDDNFRRQQDASAVSHIREKLRKGGGADPDRNKSEVQAQPPRESPASIAEKKPRPPLIRLPASILPSKNHFSIRLKSILEPVHAISQYKSLEPAPDSHRGLSSDALRSERRGRLQSQLASEADPADASPKLSAARAGPLLPAGLVGKLSAASVLRTKKSQDFKVDRAARQADSLDELVRKKADLPPPEKRSIWATEDNRQLVASRRGRREASGQPLQSQTPLKPGSRSIASDQDRSVSRVEARRRVVGP